MAIGGLWRKRIDPTELLLEHEVVNRRGERAGRGIFWNVCSARRNDECRASVIGFAHGEDRIDPRAGGLEANVAPLRHCDRKAAAAYGFNRAAIDGEKG